MDEVQKLATLVEASGEFMGDASPDGQVLYVNPAGRLLCGLEPQEVVTEMTVLDLVAERHHERAMVEIIPTIARIGRWDGELLLRNVRTGDEILTYHSAYRLNDPA